MTADMAAAIERLKQRMASGIHIAAEERRARRRRQQSHWMRQSPEERKGRRRSRLGRVARFDEE